MKTTVFERLFIIAISLTLNMLFLFWLIGASNIFGFLAVFALLVLNFMILAKSVDKLIAAYEVARREKVMKNVTKW